MQTPSTISVTCFSRRTLLGLFLLALLPRLALVLAFLTSPIGLDDMYQYDMLGRSLATGDGYRWYSRADVALLRPYLDRFYGINLPTEQVPVEGFLTTFRAPGYPFFLAGLYALAGLQNRLAIVRLAQALLGAMLAPLTAMLALRLGLGPRAARLAGIVLALYPILWMYPIGLASENTFIPLVVLGLLALLTAGQSGRALPALGAGLTLGAATLTRGALAPFLVIAALWLWRRAGLRRALLLALAATVVLIPWAVRNSLILGRPAFVENSAGYNLFVGYHPEGDGGLDVRVSVIPLRILDDGQRDRWATTQALGFIRADPIRALALLPRRLAYFWGLEDRELIYFYSNNYFGPIPQPWLTLGYLVLIGPLIAVGLSAPFGMAQASDRSGRLLSLGLIAAALIAYVPILSEPRFHLPLVPVLAAYASGFWSRPATHVPGTSGRVRPRGYWLAWAAALTLLALWTWDLALGWSRLVGVLSPGGNLLGLSY
jgi:4-amino-4-deoxy-L-arabinose transferase-like glycosyltransferase